MVMVSRVASFESEGKQRNELPNKLSLKIFRAHLCAIWNSKSRSAFRLLALRSGTGIKTAGMFKLTESRHGDLLHARLHVHD